MDNTTAASYLPDDLVVEILARLPAKSLCRFKCVSPHWRRLISDPAHRTRLTQTLSDFFFVSYSPHWRFTVLPSSVTPLEEDDDGLPLVDTALSFLPPSCGEIEILDSCNGLLLLRCFGECPSRSRPPPPFFVICNPATREWVALPQPSYTLFDHMGDMRIWYAALGFDPTISSHFYVFQVVELDSFLRYSINAVEVYSSKTSTWVLRECDESLEFLGHMTYFNGSLHLPIAYEEVVSVDPKGESWMITQVRHFEDHCHSEGDGYVGHSQGRLIYVNNDPKNDILSLYVQEDKGSREWTLKHTVSKSELLFEQWKSTMRPTYYVAGFHPNCDSIFFYDSTRKMLIFYDMNRGDWHAVCTLEDLEYAHHPFFRYVPWYSRGLASPNIN